MLERVTTNNDTRFTAEKKNRLTLEKTSDMSSAYPAAADKRAIRSSTDVTELLYTKLLI